MIDTGIGELIPNFNLEIIDGIFPLLVSSKTFLDGKRKMNNMLPCLGVVFANIRSEPSAQNDTVHQNFLAFIAGRFGAVSGFPFLSGNVVLHSG